MVDINIIDCTEDDIEEINRNIVCEEWNKLSMFPLPENIIDKYIEKLNWKIIAFNWNITKEFYEKYESHLKKYLHYIKCKNDIVL
jgi:hypothetical protein